MPYNPISEPSTRDKARAAINPSACTRKRCPLLAAPFQSLERTITNPNPRATALLGTAATASSGGDAGGGGGSGPSPTVLVGGERPRTSTVTSISSADPLAVDPVAAAAAAAAAEAESGWKCGTILCTQIAVMCSVSETHAGLLFPRAVAWRCTQEKEKQISDGTCLDISEDAEAQQLHPPSVTHKGFYS